MNKDNIIITAGGISEKIDNVRKITNSSTGKLGLLISEELLNTKYEYINKIYYVCTKNTLKPNNEKIKIIEVDNTLDLKYTIEKLLTNEKINYFIHSMAVSDYMVNYVTNSELLSKNKLTNIKEIIENNKHILNDNKISSYMDDLIIVMKKTPKIIKIIKELSPETYLVGFKLLDNIDLEKLINVAKDLRDKNNCDIVIANDLNKIRSGNHEAIILDKNDKTISAYGKNDIAKKLVKKMYSH